MAMQQQNLRPTPIFAGSIPVEGPKALPLLFSWATQNSYAVDFTMITGQGAGMPLSGVQSLFVDNGSNNGAVVITDSVLGQSVSISAGYQAFVPILVSDQSKFVVTSVGSAFSKIAFCNIMLPYGQWPANAAPVVIADPLPVSDAALEALISGGHLNVRTIPTAVTGTDRSGTIDAGGISQVLMPANASRLGWSIQNIDGSLPTEEIWYCIGSAAGEGSPGSYALAAYGAPGYPGGFAQGTQTNAIHIIALTTGHKFTSMEW